MSFFFSVILLLNFANRRKYCGKTFTIADDANHLYTLLDDSGNVLGNTEFSFVWKFDLLTPMLLNPGKLLWKREEACRKPEKH